MHEQDQTTSRLQSNNNAPPPSTSSSAVTSDSEFVEDVSLDPLRSEHSAAVTPVRHKNLASHLGSGVHLFTADFSSSPTRGRQSLPSQDNTSSPQERNASDDFARPVRFSRTVTAIDRQTLDPVSESSATPDSRSLSERDLGLLNATPVHEVISCSPDPEGIMKSHVRSKNIALHLGMEEASGPSKLGRPLVFANTVDDPELQDALAIIREYMNGPEIDQNSTPRRSYTKSVQKVRKLLGTVREHFNRSTRTPGQSRPWSLPGSHRREQRVLDPGVNEFLESVEYRLKLEEKQELEHTANDKIYEAIRIMELEPVVIRKSDYTARDLSNSQSEASTTPSREHKHLSIEGLPSLFVKHAYFDLNTTQLDRHSADDLDFDDHKLMSPRFSTSSLRVIDLIRSSHLTWSDLVLDAKRSAQVSVPFGFSESTLISSTPRGSLAIPVYDKSDLNAHRHTSADIGVDVDKLLCKIYGDDEFKRNVLSGGLFDHTEPSGLFDRDVEQTLSTQRDLFYTKDGGSGSLGTNFRQFIQQ
eukprot:jgi/Hompol1/302/HPOL_001349-RA